MSDVRIEVLIEPFKENEPGPHVVAAIEAIERAGLTADMGPFSTTADGDIDTVVDAASAALRAGLGAGATAIQLRVERNVR